MDHTVYQSTITPLSSIINDVTDTFYINLRKMIGPARLSPRGASMGSPGLRAGLPCTRTAHYRPQRIGSCLFWPP